MLLKTASLTPEVLKIVRDRGTELPYSSQLNSANKSGTYLCRQCGNGLFRTSSAFHSGCGWPSFDAEIAEHVLQKPDPDGLRTEIVCAGCEAHLGHVFRGEGFTARNLRYCVNGLSLDFVTNETVKNTEEIIVAAGCFWGVEYYFKKLKGIIKTEVGYIGGILPFPDYKTICQGNTQHVEAVRVLYDPDVIALKLVLQYFFEIHDPTQTDGQGPDRGEQYLSKIFYYNFMQKEVATILLNDLQTQEHSPIATTLNPISTFWPAEDYHQDYYTIKAQTPYCHCWRQRSWTK